ncbi:uncharacterized protein LOC118269537 [Spodoptera frugiperda]|uniref:Gustatory receptor n=1 Tax=Spodoptera frugiperda TaxID=7108 RepID=A0A9R0F4T5_SPOFR|nr:uncharacterized protein LOC118269537 [Spodoptera frugiperda]XP_050562819.1 uncharacterized protein LOC118269537 [Spodoptera frugiperda]XP_050562820.1 uncharacterized protein LOC118269537 [Spodoptera frugiperda]
MSTYFTCRCLHMVFLANSCGLNAIFKPRSWIDTRSDVPLNILTKTFGILSIIEGDYSIFCIAIFNSQYFVKLFKKLDELDTVFHVSKAVFIRRRILSTFLVILPLGQLLSTFWLRKFNIQNIGAHINFFFLMLQGSIFYFVIVNIYVKLLMLNALLIKIVQSTMSKQREIIFKDTICDWIIKSVCVEPKLVRIYQYSWFELMQIYDKLADCIHLFNEIYCGQIFVMYNTWLLGTLLTICRSLSPSLKYSEIFLSDLFLYSCINGRPLFLATISEMFIRERKKTVEVLLHVLRLHNEDDQLFNQIKTILMLVKTRELEISANVFSINVPTVMNFAGRIISYTVLMIQYFYSHDHPK